ncbi:FHA domain-containing protein [Myxococcota bacterium]|nr:FHA domain-containing protein [Myxococcota bacterium]
MFTEAGERQPVLVCTAGKLAGQRRPVLEAGLVLGRGDHCDLIVQDPGVSREHARVFLHNDAVWVQDAGSRNGCFVNGKRLSRHKALSTGDELRIGEHLFTLELVDPFPGQDSVSSFGAAPPAGAGARIVAPRTAAESEKGPLVLSLVVGLVLVAAILVAWMVARA